MLKNIKFLKKVLILLLMDIKYIQVLSIIFISVLILTSCINTEKIPPLLPPGGSISADLTYFNEAGEESTYYNDATEKIVYWQILINDSLSFQKDLLETAIDNDLEYQSDETWLIRDKLNRDDKSYDILLFCIDETDTLNLKLYFSFDTVYTNLLTYDGISFNDNTQGDWTINKPEPDTSAYIKFLSVNWNIISEENKEIKFTNFLSGGENGNYIFYKDSTDDIYDSYIDLFDKANENHTIIQWSSNTNTGRIQDIEKYGNEDWYCWDENFLNTDCNK